MRKAVLADWPMILVALEKLKHFAESYPWVHTVDWAKGTAVVMSSVIDGNAFVIDGYLVLVDEVTPWYTTDKLLQEWLTIKLISGGSVASIPPELETLASLRHCVSVITADSSPVGIVAKAYKDAGYSNLTTSFYKAL